LNRNVSVQAASQNQPELRRKCLPYPEGTACAEVFVAGDKVGTESKTLFAGLGIGSLYEFLMNGLKLWNSKPSWDIPFYKGGKINSFNQEAIV
jgi:uncharacterized oligopeptide transporter (OPT) family protein